jgi:hypothetical protein
LAALGGRPDDEAGLHHLDGTGRSRAVQHGMQQARQPAAHLVRAQVEGGDRRAAGAQRRAVHAGRDEQVFGHPTAELSGGHQRADGAAVDAADHRVGRGVLTQRAHGRVTDHLGRGRKWRVVDQFGVTAGLCPGLVGGAQLQAPRGVRTRCDERDPVGALVGQLVEQGGQRGTVVALHSPGTVRAWGQVPLAGDHRDAQLRERAHYRVARHRVHGHQPVDRERGQPGRIVGPRDERERQAVGEGLARRARRQLQVIGEVSGFLRQVQADAPDPLATQRPRGGVGLIAEPTRDGRDPRAGGGGQPAVAGQRVGHRGGGHPCGLRHVADRNPATGCHPPMVTPWN